MYSGKSTGAGQAIILATKVIKCVLLTKKKKNSLFFQKKKYIMSSIQSKSILLLLAHLSIHQSFVHLIVLNITFYFDSTSSKGTGIQYTPWIQKCQQ